MAANGLFAIALLLAASGLASAADCPGYGTMQYGAYYAARAVPGYSLESISGPSDGRQAMLNVGGSQFQVGPAGNFTFYTPAGDYLIFDICHIGESTVSYKVLDSRAVFCNGFPSLTPSSEPLIVGGYSLRLSIVDIAANRSAYGHPAVFYLERNGTGMGQFSVLPGSVHTLSSGGDKIEIFVCTSGFASSLSTHHAYVGMKVTANGSAASANATGNSTAGEKDASCSTLPVLELPSGGIRMHSGESAKINATITATHPASCGAQAYGLDFTNGYDGNRFSLWLDGKRERNLFTLQSGESRTFTANIGLPPGVPAGNYTVQLTAYSEGDHWKQASKNVVVQAKGALDSDASLVTNLEVGWNTIPYAPGLMVFGCDNITYAYRYSSSLGEYVRMERFGAEFSDGQGMQNGAGASALFVFSKRKCTMRSYVSPAALDNLPIEVGAGALVSVLPKWDGKATWEIAGQLCPEGATISQWDPILQKWASPQRVAFGGAIRIVAKPGTACQGGIA